MKSYRAILWDVYGTLLIAPRGDLDSLIKRVSELRSAFVFTAQHFALPVTGEELHANFIHTLQEVRRTGMAHQEIRIENIWQGLLGGVTEDFARQVALFFERRANPKLLQPHTFETLVELKRRGLRQGIISNAQFYTPIELTELLAAESDCPDCTYESIFDSRLIFLSCNFGVAKPDLTMFRAAAAELARDGIAPAECLFVGNSPTDDIAPARAVGFATWLLAPDGDLSELLTRV